MRVLLAPLLLLAALAGCAGEPPGAPDAPAGAPSAPAPPAGPDAAAPNATGLPGEAVPVRLVAVGDESALPFPMRLVLAGPEEWSSFWREHEKRRSAEDGTPLPPSEPPAVDFAAERVVVVTLGDVRDTCAAVRVGEARLHEGRTSLTVTTYRGGPEMGCAEEPRQPYVMVTIPQDGSEVVYRDAEAAGRPPDGA